MTNLSLQIEFAKVTKLSLASTKLNFQEKFKYANTLLKKTKHVAKLNLLFKLRLEQLKK